MMGPPGRGAHASPPKRPVHAYCMASFPGFFHVRACFIPYSLITSKPGVTYAAVERCPFHLGRSRCLKLSADFYNNRLLFPRCSCPPSVAAVKTLKEAGNLFVPCRRSPLCCSIRKERPCGATAAVAIATRPRGQGERRHHGAHSCRVLPVAVPAGRGWPYGGFLSSSNSSRTRSNSGSSSTSGGCCFVTTAAAL